MATDYRPAVAAILQDSSGRILICERADRRGAWQFPQGGIGAGGKPEETLAREVLEEILLPRSAYEIAAVRGPYRYRFPGGITRKGFRGQSHHYFLLRLRGSKTLIDTTAANAEFRSSRWILPEEFDFGWLPPMKRRAYRRVLHDFFGTPSSGVNSY